MGEVITGHWRELRPSPFICAADLQGREVVVIVDRCEKDEIVREGGKKERIPLMYLRNTRGSALPKAMVLNATNTNTMIAMFGPIVAEWRGKAITLYAAPTRFGGKSVEGIRIRNKPATVPTTDDTTTKET